KPWSRNAYFLSYVHLFSDTRRLGALEDNSLCHHSERCPDTTGARLQYMPEYLTRFVIHYGEGQRNALPWTDVTLIISYE
ncbi:hypothetical protein C0J52_05291, partial [Blattella germanica]